MGAQVHAPSHSTALPIAWITLRILIILNWAYGACLLAILGFSFINEPFLLRALKLGSPSENPALVWEFERSRRSDCLPSRSTSPCSSGCWRWSRPSAPATRSSPRTRTPAGHRLVLLGLQLLSIVIGLIGKAISTPAHPLHLDAGFSPSGWLAVLLTFVLARVFAEGTLMREDLEGTV